jgi:hypothetical protein
MPHNKSKKQSNTNVKKTIKQHHHPKSKQQTVEFIQHTMNYLATIKMYHWTTDSFATHKATDALYAKLQTLMDLFVETSLGHYNNKKSLHNSIKKVEIKDIKTNKDLHSYTQKYKMSLRQIRKQLPDSSQSEMINVVDDILTELDVLLYLLTLE